MLQVRIAASVAVASAAFLLLAQQATQPVLIRKVDPQYTEDARKWRIEGTVVVAAQISAEGAVESARVTKSLDPGLDQKALEAVRQWKFKPATVDGEPVAVEASFDVEFRLPPARHTSSPTLLHKVEPEYTQEAKDARIEGTVVLRCEVTPEGRADNIEVVRGLGSGLDQKAIEALRQWKFRPAVRDGEPVVVKATVEINFRLP